MDEHILENVLSLPFIITGKDLLEQVMKTSDEWLTYIDLPYLEHCLEEYDATHQNP